MKLLFLVNFVKIDSAWKGMKSQGNTYHLLRLLFVRKSRGEPFRSLSWQETNAVAEPEYWVQHVAQAVRFFDAMKGCSAKPIIEQSTPFQPRSVGFSNFFSQGSLFFWRISSQMATDLHIDGVDRKNKSIESNFPRDFWSGNFGAIPESTTRLFISKWNLVKCVKSYTT